MSRNFPIFSLLVAACCTPWASADDFNRPSVGYTNNGAKIGWYWQAKGTGTWKLIDHELLVDNADASVQNNDQVLYHTRVSLQSGNWSASVDVRDATATRRVGLAFMVGANGTNFYQIRLQFGSKQVQVLENGAAGIVQTIYTNDNASSEVFNTGKYYTISAWSTAAGQINWEVNNAGSDVNWTSRRTSEGYQVASGSFTDTTYTSGYAGIVKSQGDGVTDVAHFDNFYVREITVPPITSPHPRLLVTPADVVQIKAAIDAKVEPRYSAWLDLQYYANGWSNENVGSPYTGQDSDQFYNLARQAGRKSSKMALAWLLKGNAAHAAKAKAILLAWAQANPLPGSNFPPDSTNFEHSGMKVARSINGFVYAYDFLYNYLTPAERTTVETWFRAMLPSLQAGIDQWNTPTSSFLGSIYFSGGYYQNHTVSPTMGYLLIGYALGDQSLVQFALDHKDNPRPYLTLFDGTMLMPGETFPDVGPGDTMNPPPQAGEIFDRERHSDTGSGHPNGAGLSYSALSRNQMMSMTEVLYNNGLNFYTRTGAHGETMLAPFNFFADFYRLGDDSIKGGFYTGEGVSANYNVAVFEVANKRYPGNPEITALLNSVDRTAVDSGGDIESYFVFPTLTHGVSLQTLPASTKTWTGAASSTWNTTELNWTGESWTDGSDAVFGATGAGAITVSGTRILNDLTISAAGYSFTGGTLSLNNTTATNNTWSIANDTTIASAVSLTATTSAGVIFNKTGAGKLLFSGPVTITGNNSFFSSVAGTVEFSGGLTATNTGIFSTPGNVLISGGTNVLSGTSSRKGIVIGGNGGTFTVSGGTTTAAALNAANGSTGTYTQSGGTVTLKSDSNVSQSVALGAGTGNSLSTSTVNLDGGTLTALGMAPGTGWLGTNTINLNGGTFQCGAANTSLFKTDVTGSGAGSIFVKSGGALIDTNSFAVTQVQPLLAGSPSGGLTKSGAGTLTLSGLNTYTGPTTVSGGVLAVNGSSIANSNKLVLDGGKVDLTGAETIGTLFFGAVQQSAGTYSATGAGGTIASSNLTGAGTLIVTSGPVSGYSTWASANAGSQAADLDFDNDGMPNGVEYFMGQTGSTFTANPPVVTVGAVSTVTWPRDTAAVATFKVQISDTLAVGGWTDIVPPDASIDQSNPNQVTYTLPSGAPTKFCRLSVTP